MTCFIDQDIGLTDASVKEKETTRLSKTHPFEVPVDHSLTVHVDQAFCDVGQLREPRNRQQQVRVAGAQMDNLQVRTDSHPDVLSRTR